MKIIFVFAALLWLSCGFATAQDDDFIAILKKRIALQNKNRARVKLDLFFHQPKYSPGDTALVRTLYVGAVDHKPIGGRELVYVQLHDRQGAIVFNEHFVVVNGWSSNKLVIPEDISPGVYALVAYTDWMKNEDASLFFRSDFLITGIKTLQREAITSRDAVVEFYPEGGSLIAGLPNHITVRKSGGKSATAVVIRDGAQEIAQSMFDPDGLASVEFTPALGGTYHAELQGSAEAGKFDLPPIVSEGFTVHVSPSPSGAFSIKVNSSIQTETGRIYAVLCNSQGLIFYNKLEFGKEHSVMFDVPAGLPDGVAQLMIVDEYFKAWATRPVFIKRVPEFEVKFLRLKAAYPTRADGAVIVDVKDRNGKPVAGYFTARIVNREIFRDTTDRFDPSDNLLLYSDISSTFKLRYPASHDRILSYLNTQSCPWLNWTEIQTGKISEPTIPPETNLKLSGKVVLTATQQPLLDSTHVMFFFQRQMVGYERMMRNNGSFNFPVLFDFTGPDEVIYTASLKGKDVPGISVKLDPLDTVYSFKAQETSVTNIEDAYGKFSQQKKMIDKSYYFFTKLKNATDSTADLNHFIERELNGADIVFKTSDYILFPTMEDLIREVLKAVDLRKIKGKNVVRVYTTNKLPTSYATPLYVIDGVMTKETSEFLSLIPSKIISIKIIRNSTKLSRWRTFGANGIILVRTTIPEVTRARIKPDYIFPVNGTALPYSGSDISWKGKNEMTPDLRASLQWNTNILLDEKGMAILRFKTSDDAARFTIQLEGMTENGNLFSKKQDFTVHYDPQP